MKKCRGACVGQESARQHNARLLNVLALQRIKPWPFPGRIGLREEDRAGSRVDIHIVDHWHYLGTIGKGADWDELPKGSAAVDFDFDSYTILRRYWKKNGPRLDIVSLS